MSTRPPVEPYKLWSPNEVFTIPPPEWAMDNILLKGGSTLVWGPTNVGKSLLTLDWCMRLAMGMDWLGQRVEKEHRIAYLYAEGAGGLQLRYRAYLEENDLLERVYQLNKNMRFLALDETIRLTPDEKGQDLTEPQARLMRTLAEWEPDFVVFDPVQEIFAGIDNTNDAMVQKVMHLRDAMNKQFGAGTIFVHHANASESRFRGVTTWMDLVDTGFHIWEPEGSGRPVKLATEKNRHGSKNIYWTMTIKQVELALPRLRGQTSAVFSVGEAATVEERSREMQLRDVLVGNDPMRFGELEALGFNKNWITDMAKQGLIAKTDPDNRASPYVWAGEEKL